MRNKALLIEIIMMYENQKGFAKKLGISDSIVSEVINGKRNLSDRQKKKWARVLKCGVIDVF